MKAFYQPDFTTLQEYPRAETIEDSEALMHITATERLFERYAIIQRELQKLRDEVAIIKTDLDSHKIRLFLRLREVSPVVAGSYGYGWRKFEHTYYIVGWDAPSGSTAPPEEEI